MQRHPQYFLPGGDLYLQIENILFRVHRYFFERDSHFFQSILATPARPGEAQLGDSEISALVLENVKIVDFECLLWVFYNPKYSVYEATVEEWTSILELAYRWDFNEILSLATREIEKLDISDAARIALYHKYNLDRQLLTPCYASLCTREHPLTFEEGSKLGLETMLRIARIREHLLHQATKSQPYKTSESKEELLPLLLEEHFGLKPLLEGTPSTGEQRQDHQTLLDKHHHHLEVHEKTVGTIHDNQECNVDKFVKTTEQSTIRDIDIDTPAHNFVLSGPRSDQDVRLNVSMAALDHAISKEQNIREALEAVCSTDDATYLIQVGFNEEMIRARQGVLQEIHIFVNFDIQQNDEPRILDQLGHILSPFPTTIYTPATTLQVPIIGPERKQLETSDIWTLFRSHNICWPENTLQTEDHLPPISFKDQRVDVTQGRDERARMYGCTENSDTGGAGGTGSRVNLEGTRGGTGSSTSAQQTTDQGGSGVSHPEGDRFADGTPPPPLVNATAASVSNAPISLLRDSGGDPESDPNSKLEQRRHATLDVPLSTVAKIKWDQEPVTSQEFNTASRLRITVRDVEDTITDPASDSFPTPSLEARFHKLHVGTEVKAESQVQYCLHSIQVRTSASLHPTPPKPLVLDWSPCITLRRSETVKETRVSGKSRSLSFSVTQSPSLGYADARVSTSGVEESRNTSMINAGPCDISNPEISAVKWIFDIDDSHERQVGRTFREPPQVKFSFYKFAERPRVGVGLVVLWSLPASVCAGARQRNNHRSWLPFKNKKRCLPVFRNFFQQVSTSLQLDDLEGNCYIRGTTIAPSTMKPVQNSDDGLLCEEGAVESAWNKMGVNTLNVEAKFRCALYGCVRDVQALSEQVEKAQGTDRTT